MSGLPEKVREYYWVLGYVLTSFDLGHQKLRTKTPVGYCPGTADFEHEVVKTGQKIMNEFIPRRRKHERYENKPYDKDFDSETAMIDKARRFLNGEGNIEGQNYLLGYMFFRYCAELAKMQKLQ